MKKHHHSPSTSGQGKTQMASALPMPLPSGPVSQGASQNMPLQAAPQGMPNAASAVPGGMGAGQFTPDPMPKAPTFCSGGRVGR